MLKKIFLASLLVGLSTSLATAQDQAQFQRARECGRRFDEMAAAAQRVLKAWLTYADTRTLLLPDFLPGWRGLKPGDHSRLYTPHNSGADLYPYLILTAFLTDPHLYRGRMLEMLRNEVRFTTQTDSIPANLDLNSGKLGPMSLFGAGEYAKDNLRLNEFPEWYVVDENTLYRLHSNSAAERV